MYVSMHCFVFQVVLAASNSENVYYVSYGVSMMTKDMGLTEFMSSTYEHPYWSCTCNDWKFRKRQIGKSCKHIDRARNSMWHPVTEYDIHVAVRLGKDGLPELCGDGFVVPAIYVPDESASFNNIDRNIKNEKIVNQRKRFV